MIPMTTLTTTSLLPILRSSRQTDTSTIEKPRKPFIEANTREVTLEHLQRECIVPVFAKDNEVTISHNLFIQAVQTAVNDLFRGEYVMSPEVRVSHIIKGRTPDAIHKQAADLTEQDKTIYYERMAFVMEVPAVSADIDGCKLNLSIGGVRAYNHENLFSRKVPEKFKVFIGFKNLVCCNLCVSTDGLCEELRAFSPDELYHKVGALISRYRGEEHLNAMVSMLNYSLTESQFAQLIGKSRLYQFMPVAVKRKLPLLEFTDSHLNLIARNYYRDPDFAALTDTREINLWRLYNLFTGANKSSYIDSFLSRSVNATEFLQGIARALDGNYSYKWWIE